MIAGRGPCDGFDAYDATIFGPAEVVFDELACLMLSAGFDARQEDGPKVRFYARNRLLLDPKGHRLLSLKWGGANPHPHVECKGAEAAVLARFLRAGVPHRPTRIDHAHDLHGERLFDRAA